MIGATAEPRQAPAPEAIEDETYGGVSPYPEPEDRATAIRTEQGRIEYVEDILRAGRIMTVAAEEGTGKSYAISGEMALRIAVAGGQFAGTWRVETKAPVLYISEMHTDDDFDREDEIMKELQISRADLESNYYRLSVYTATKDVPPLADAGWTEYITNWCREHGVKVLIFDTATSATDRDAWGKDFQPVFKALRAMSASCPDLAIILVVHMKKPSGGRGGSRGLDAVIGEWGRWNDVTMMLENEGSDFTRTKITVRKRVRNQRRIIATKHNGLLINPIDVTKSGPRVSREDQLAAIKAAPGLTIAAFAAAIGVSKQTAAKYLDGLGQAVNQAPLGAKKTIHLYAADLDAPTAAAAEEVGADARDSDGGPHLKLVNEDWGAALAADR